MRLREIQSLEQLSDAELGVEDLRARLRDLSGGAEFLTAAVRGRAKGCVSVSSARRTETRRRKEKRKRKSNASSDDAPLLGYDRVERRCVVNARSRGHRVPRAFPPVHVVRLDHRELLANHAHLTHDAVLGLRELRQSRDERGQIGQRRHRGKRTANRRRRGHPKCADRGRPSAETENVRSVEMDRRRARIARAHLVHDRVVVPAFRAAAAASSTPATTASTASTATERDRTLGFLLLRLGGEGDDRPSLSCRSRRPSLATRVSAGFARRASRAVTRRPAGASVAPARLCLTVPRKTRGQKLQSDDLRVDVVTAHDPADLLTALARPSCSCEIRVGGASSAPLPRARPSRETRTRVRFAAAQAQIEEHVPRRHRRRRLRRPGVRAHARQRRCEGCGTKRRSGRRQGLVHHRGHVGVRVVRPRGDFADHVAAEGRRAAAPRRGPEAKHHRAERRHREAHGDPERRARVPGAVRRAGVIPRDRRGRVRDSRTGRVCGHVRARPPGEAEARHPEDRRGGETRRRGGKSARPSDADDADDGRRRVGRSRFPPRRDGRSP